MHPVGQLKFSSPEISAFLPEFSLENSSVFSVRVTRSLHAASKKPHTNHQ